MSSYSANQTAVSELYVALLGRNPDQNGYAYWVNSMNGGQTQTQQASLFAYQPEFFNAYAALNTTQAIGRIYSNVFGRAADAGGLAYWSGVANAMVAEGTATVVAYAQTATQMIDYAYVTESSDQAYIQNEVNAASAAGTAQPTTTYTLTTGVDTIAGGSNMAVVGTGTTFTPLDSITGTGTNNSLTINDSTGASASGVPAGVKVSGIQTTTINGSASIGAAASQGTTAVAQVQTLTVSATPAASGDTATVSYGTNSMVVSLGNGTTAHTVETAGAAIASAINTMAGSTIAVASTTTGAVVVTAPTAGTALPAISVGSWSASADSVGFSNVTTTANVPGVAPGSAVVYDVSGFTGLTQFNANSTTGANLNAATTTNVTETNSTSGAVTVNGGNAVTVTQAATGAVTIGGTTAGAGLVTVNDSSTGSITVSGGASAAINQTSTTTSGSVTVSGVTGGTTVTAESSDSNGAVSVVGGTGVTVNTFGGGTITAGGTAATGQLVAGTVSIADTNTNFLTSNTDTVAVYGTGQINVTTGALASGSSMAIGTTTAAQDSTVGVNVVSQTGTVAGAEAITVYVNAAPSVSITGGTADAITDEATTNGLATVSLTNTPGEVTIGSTALTTLDLNSIVGAGSGTSQSVTVTGSATAPVANLTINATAAGSINATAGDKWFTVEDNFAKAITVNALSTSAFAIEDTANSSTAGKFSSLAINATGNFKLEALTLASVGTQSVAITTAGAGNVTLGDLSGATSSTDKNVASITASGTGNVSAEMNAYYTTFAGGASGNDTVTLDYGSVTPTVSSIVGSTGGSNTLVLTDTAANLGLGSGLTATNFQTLEVGKGANTAAAAGTYHAAGYTTVGVIGATAATNTAGIVFDRLASGTNLVQTAVASNSAGSAANVTYTLATAAAAATGNAATFTYGSATTGTTNFTVDAGNDSGLYTSEANVQNLTVNSVNKGNAYTGEYSNTIAITDTTSTAAANSLTTVTVTGNADTSLKLASSNGVNALSAVNVTGTGATTVTIADANTAASTGLTVTGGAGTLTVTNTYIKNIVSGAGGVAATIAANSGSINLGASLGKSDSIVNGADNTSYATTIASFSASLANADAITLASGETAILAKGNGSTTSGGTYTVANGVITFGGSESANINTQLSDVEGLLAAAGSANGSSAVFYNAGTGNTYVVSSYNSYALSTNTYYNTVDTLTGVSGITSVGTTAAANSVELSGATFTANTAVTTLPSSASASQDETGYNAAAYTAAATAAGGTLTTYTNTFANLAQSALLTVTNTATATYTDMGQIATTQVGASGTNSLTVALASVPGSGTTDLGITVDKLTVAGDAALTITTSEHDSSAITDVVTQLVDSTNTLTTLTLASTGSTNPALTIAGITSTSLATIDAHSDAGVITLGASGAGNALSQAGLVVKGALGGTTAYLSGAGDVITTTSATAVSINASGAGDSITLTSNTHNGVDAANIAGTQAIYVTGAGDTIDASNMGTGTGNYAITIQGATANTAVGANAIVKLGVGTSATYADFAYAGTGTTVSIGGAYDIVNVSNTAAGYGTTGNITTIQLGSHLGSAVTAYANTDSVVFGGTNNTFTSVGVNVAGATTLDAALTIAATAAEAAGTVNGTHDSINWFQFGGNTYIYQAAGTGASGTHSTTGVDVTDTVVKVVGLVDLSAANGTISAHTVLL
jgi:hypothetical protein